MPTPLHPDRHLLVPLPTPSPLPRPDGGGGTPPSQKLFMPSPPRLQLPPRGLPGRGAVLKDILTAFVEEDEEIVRRRDPTRGVAWRCPEPRWGP